MQLVASLSYNSSLQKGAKHDRQYSPLLKTTFLSLTDSSDSAESVSLNRRLLPTSSTPELR